MRAIKWFAAILLTLLALPAAAQGEAGYDWRPAMTVEMPVVSIRTTDGSSGFATEPYRDMKIQEGIDYVDAEITVTGGDFSLNAAKAQVKARGNYTLDYPKKSIRIKFDKKQPMLGLHDGEKYKNWALLTEWKDLSMTHTPVGLYLSHAILGSDGYYVTDGRNVEV